MKETQFIDQNKEKWLDFEKNLQEKNANPAKTAKLFIQITDDLSYARTFYPNRSVKLYLNGIAKLLFNDLNKSNKKGFTGFINFWKTDLPLIMYSSRRAMLISFLVFVSCFILGIVTSMHDKEFARTILSNDYVNMTNENISKGDAMAVYKSDGEFETFLPILYNNLRVNFLTFFSGILMAIGSLVVMVVNGVMVGVFQYYFIERGLFWESFLTIWTHGALEISAIIICGGAGITLGKGLLFPGTYSRFQAFKLSGMKGLKIILGVAPVTFLAAFIEGFLTRHTSIPDGFRLVFILLSFSFILVYFFFYPRKIAKQGLKERDSSANALIYKPEIEFNPSEIYSGNKLITETFGILFRNFVFFGKFLILIPLLYSVLIAWNPLELFRRDGIFNFGVTDFYNYSEFPFLGILMIFSFVGTTLLSLNFLKKTLHPKDSENIALQSSVLFKTGISALLCITLFSFVVFTDVDFSIAVSQLTFPFLVFFICISNFQNSTIYESVNNSGSLLSQGWSKFILTALAFAMIGLLVYLTTGYALKMLFIQDALIWMLTDNGTQSLTISVALVVFQTYLSFFLYLVLSLISNSLIYFTLQEAYSAQNLVSKIQTINTQK
jgi:uncharacterized membrane protein SpoIIM required for sporulation